jgi:CRP-like cAMP-binding protein
MGEGRGCARARGCENVVAALAEPVRFPAGRAIVREGGHGDALYVLIDGRARVVREGRRSPLAHLGPGDHVGELSLIDGRPRSASVVAETRVFAATLSRASFRRLLRREPDVGMRVMEQLSGLVRGLQRDQAP